MNKQIGEWRYNLIALQQNGSNKVVIAEQKEV